jgi:hypothetical protein
VFAAMTHKHVFDVRPNDVYACAADIGWITGTTNRRSAPAAAIPVPLIAIPVPLIAIPVPLIAIPVPLIAMPVPLIAIPVSLIANASTTDNRTRTFGWIGHRAHVRRVRAALQWHDLRDLRVPPELSAPWPVPPEHPA